MSLPPILPPYPINIENIDKEREYIDLAQTPADRTPQFIIAGGTPDFAYTPGGGTPEFVFTPQGGAHEFVSTPDIIIRERENVPNQNYDGVNDKYLLSGRGKVGDNVTLNIKNITKSIYTDKEKVQGEEEEEEGEEEKEELGAGEQSLSKSIIKFNRIAPELPYYPDPEKDYYYNFWNRIFTQRDHHTGEFKDGLPSAVASMDAIKNAKPGTKTKFQQLPHHQATSHVFDIGGKQSAIVNHGLGTTKTCAAMEIVNKFLIRHWSMIRDLQIDIKNLSSPPPPSPAKDGEKPQEESAINKKIRKSRLAQTKKKLEDIAKKPRARVFVIYLNTAVQSTFRTHYFLCPTVLRDNKDIFKHKESINDADEEHHIADDIEIEEGEEEEGENVSFPDDSEEAEVDAAERIRRDLKKMPQASRLRTNIKILRPVKFWTADAFLKQAAQTEFTSRDVILIDEFHLLLENDPFANKRTREKLWAVFLQVYKLRTTGPMNRRPRLAALTATLLGREPYMLGAAFNSVMKKPSFPTPKLASKYMELYDPSSMRINKDVEKILKDAWDEHWGPSNLGSNVDKFRTLIRGLVTYLDLSKEPMVYAQLRDGKYHDEIEKLGIYSNNAELDEKSLSLLTSYISKESLNPDGPLWSVEAKVVLPKKKKAAKKKQKGAPVEELAIGDEEEEEEEKKEEEEEELAGQEGKPLYADKFVLATIKEPKVVDNLFKSLRGPKNQTPLGTVIKLVNGLKVWQTKQYYSEMFRLLSADSHKFQSNDTYINLFKDIRKNSLFMSIYVKMQKSYESKNTLKEVIQNEPKQKYPNGMKEAAEKYDLLRSFFNNYRVVLQNIVFQVLNELKISNQDELIEYKDFKLHPTSRLGSIIQCCVKLLASINDSGTVYITTNKQKLEGLIKKEEIDIEKMKPIFNFGWMPSLDDVNPKRIKKVSKKKSKITKKKHRQEEEEEEEDEDEDEGDEDEQDEDIIEENDDESDIPHADITSANELNKLKIEWPVLSKLTGVTKSIYFLEEAVMCKNLPFLGTSRLFAIKNLCDQYPLLMEKQNVASKKLFDQEIQLASKELDIMIGALISRICPKYLIRVPEDKDVEQSSLLARARKFCRCIENGAKKSVVSLLQEDKAMTFHLSEHIKVSSKKLMAKRVNELKNKDSRLQLMTMKEMFSIKENISRDSTLTITSKLKNQAKEETSKFVLWCAAKLISEKKEIYENDINSTFTRGTDLPSNILGAHLMQYVESEKGASFFVPEFPIVTGSWLIILKIHYPDGHHPWDKLKFLGSKPPKSRAGVNELRRKFNESKYKMIAENIKQNYSFRHWVYSEVPGSIKQFSDFLVQDEKQSKAFWQLGRYEPDAPASGKKSQVITSRASTIEKITNEFISKAEKAIKSVKSVETSKGETLQKCLKENKPKSPYIGFISLLTKTKADQDEAWVTEKNNKMVQLFNGDWNQEQHFVSTVMGTGPYNVSISLHDVHYVHLMNVSNVSVDKDNQAVYRAIRMGKHLSYPTTVKVIRYQSEFDKSVIDLLDGFTLETFDTFYIARNEKEQEYRNKLEYLLKEMSFTCNAFDNVNQFDFWVMQRKKNAGRERVAVRINMEREVFNPFNDEPASCYRDDENPPEIENVFKKKGESGEPDPDIPPSLEKLPGLWYFESGSVQRYVNNVQHPDYVYNENDETVLKRLKYGFKQHLTDEFIGYVDELYIGNGVVDPIDKIDIHGLRPANKKDSLQDIVQDTTESKNTMIDSYTNLKWFTGWLHKYTAEAWRKERKTIYEQACQKILEGLDDVNIWNGELVKKEMFENTFSHSLTPDKDGSKPAPYFSQRQVQNWMKLLESLLGEMEKYVNPEGKSGEWMRSLNYEIGLQISADSLSQSHAYVSALKGSNELTLNFNVATSLKSFLSNKLNNGDPKNTLYYETGPINPYNNFGQYMKQIIEHEFCHILVSVFAYEYGSNPMPHGPFSDGHTPFFARLLYSLFGQTDMKVENRHVQNGTVDMAAFSSQLEFAKDVFVCLVTGSVPTWAPAKIIHVSMMGNTVDVKLNNPKEFGNLYAYESVGNYMIVDSPSGVIKNVPITLLKLPENVDKNNIHQPHISHPHYSIRAPALPVSDLVTKYYNHPSF